MVERSSAKVSSDNISDDKAEEGSSVQIPASPQTNIDVLAAARAKAEALFNKLK